MCMVLGASEAWCFFFLRLFSTSTPPPLPPASPSCPSPPSPLSYWEVFHEQLGPGRGEVSERGALCIIQWLSGVCVCLRVLICVCVCVPPPLLAGVRWRARHVTGCQLAFYWSSHTVLNITISWWGALESVSAPHTLICSSDVTVRDVWESDHVSKAHHSENPSFFYTVSAFSVHFPPQEIEFIRSGYILKILTSHYSMKT